jgi:hypothetical protein
MVISESLSRRPAEIASAEQMYMQVKHRLSRAGANIQNGAIAVFDVSVAGNLRGDEMAATDDFCVGLLRFFQTTQVLLGDDEYVSWRLGIDVLERVRMFVFINFFGRNLAGDDFAEEAISHIRIRVRPTANDQQPTTVSLIQPHQEYSALDGF